MAVAALLPKGINLKTTESYLLNLVGVADASVWWQDGSMHAHVVVLDKSPLTSKDIQMLCMRDIGIHQTPREITVAVRCLRAA